MCIDENGNLLSTEADDQQSVMVPVEFLKELFEMRTRFLNILKVQSPGEGHSLQILEDKAWVDWSSLRFELFKRINAAVSAGGTLLPNYLATFPNGDGWVAVSASHIIDDYWWIECRASVGALPAINRSDHPAFWALNVHEGPDTAVLRFVDSRKCLPYSANTSPRITSDY